MIKAAVKVEKLSVDEIAKGFLRDVFGAMNMEVAVDVQYEEESGTMNIDLALATFFRFHSLLLQNCSVPIVPLVVILHHVRLLQHAPRLCAAGADASRIRAHGSLVRHALSLRRRIIAGDS